MKCLIKRHLLPLQDIIQLLATCKNEQRKHRIRLEHKNKHTKKKKKHVQKQQNIPFSGISSASASVAGMESANELDTGANDKKSRKFQKWIKFLTKNKNKGKKDHKHKVIDWSVAISRAMTLNMDPHNRYYVVNSISKPYIMEFVELWFENDQKERERHEHLILELLQTDLDVNLCDRRTGMML